MGQHGTARTTSVRQSVQAIHFGNDQRSCVATLRLRDAFARIAGCFASESRSDSSESVFAFDDRNHCLEWSGTRNFVLDHSLAGPSMGRTVDRSIFASQVGEQHINTSDISSRTLQIKWVDGRVPETPGNSYPLGERLKAKLSDGGCAAVICNTVSRAQQVFCALRPHFAEGELDLFHARFLFTDRDQREKRSLLLQKTSETGGEDE